MLAMGVPVHFISPSSPPLADVTSGCLLRLQVLLVLILAGSLLNTVVFCLLGCKN
jgi:hypothetical protein